MTVSSLRDCSSRAKLSERRRWQLRASTDRLGEKLATRRAEDDFPRSHRALERLHLSDGFARQNATATETLGSVSMHAHASGGDDGFQFNLKRLA